MVGTHERGEKLAREFSELIESRSDRGARSLKVAAELANDPINGVGDVAEEAVLVRRCADRGDRGPPIVDIAGDDSCRTKVEPGPFCRYARCLWPSINQTGVNLSTL